jgi:outer membrane protein TolC
MRGGSPAANLAVLRQAGLDVRASEYELRGAAEALIADVETAYWDFCLAGERIAIYEESVRLAEKQLEETRVRIEIGARGALETARIRLLRLLGPPGVAWGESAARFWSREVAPLDRPAAPDAGPAEVEEHVAKALASRPDLNQARLGVERGDLELVRTRNGLLPRLDLFVNLGRTGYADSFSSAFRDLGDGYHVSAGVALEHTLGNRSARARQRRAAISRAEAELALANLANLAQVDVRTAHVAAATARERIAATAAARTLQEEALRAETEKFRVGKSTTFQVAQAQRDLVSARIAEVESVVGYLQALVGLHRADGSILERRGVSAPGAREQ